MKTTLEIPDELYRAVKAKAAMEGRRVTDLVIDGLRLRLEGPEKPVVQVEFPILKSKRSGPKISLEDLKRAQEEMDDYEVQKLVQPLRR
jgi:hypothetical protein